AAHIAITRDRREDPDRIGGDVGHWNRGGTGPDVAPKIRTIALECVRPEALSHYGILDFQPFAVLVRAVWRARKVDVLEAVNDDIIHSVQVSFDLAQYPLKALFINLTL